MCKIRGVLFFELRSLNIQRTLYRVDIRSNRDVRVLLETCPECRGFQLNDANGKIFWLTPFQHDPCFTRILTQNVIPEDI